MSDPSRLCDDATTDTFERALLRSGVDDREPEDGAARALAALGLTTAAAGVASVGASASGHGAAAGTSIAVKLAALVLVTSGIVGAIAALAAHDDETPSTATRPTVLTEAEPVSSPPIETPPEPVAVSVADLPSAAATPPVVIGTSQKRASASSVQVSSKRSVSAEIALIDEARAATRTGETERAARMLDAYDARFAHGTLFLEAKLARIELHLARSEHDEAGALCERFLSEHPQSAYDRRVRALLQRARSERTIVQ